jgi:hypothetical protein
MVMSINYHNENNLGVFHLRGEKNFNEAIDAWKRILHAIQKDSPHAIVVFDNSTSKLYCYEVITIARWLNKVSFPKDHKIAFIDPNLTKKSMSKFGEVVAFNKGWYKIKVFKDEAKAREWLKHPGYGWKGGRP